MDPARELAQIFGRPRESFDCLVERLRGGRGITIEHIAGGAQTVSDPDQLLLRSVVQITLDPATLGIRGRDYPGARRMQLFARYGVRDGGRDKLCEIHEPRFGLLGELLVAGPDRDDDAPDATLG